VTPEVASQVASPAGPLVHRPALLSVGAVVWLSSELMFFSGLFAAYYTLRAQSAVWPPAGANLDTLTATVGTALLIISSGTMQLSVRAIEQDDRQTFVSWLAATFILGAVFVSIQGWDWSRLHFAISSGAYGSIFYLMTGFHGLHVIGGLLAMVVMAGRAASPRFGARDTPAVELLSYYWHFVDIVWIGLYGTIFLIR
jgi:cytochrome c oxidase subunit 3